MAWRGNSGSSKNTTYAVSKSGMKVAPGSAAYDRVIKSGGAKVTLDNGDGGYVRRNADGSTTSYNSIYSTNAGSGGGGGGGSSAYKSYLEDARRSAIDAQNARIQAALDQVAGQQADINKSANDAAQQAYIAKEKTLMQNPQQLAALGISGGGSESALLGINTGYENNRNTIMQNRDRAIRENENQQNQIRATGDASLADIENQYYNQLAQYQAQQQQYEQQRQDQLNDIQSQRDYEQQVWERNNAYAAKLAAQKAAQTSSGSSSSTANFNNLMKLYEATSDKKYLDAASSLVGISNSALSSNSAYPATVLQTGTYNDTWVQSLIRTYQNMGMTNEQIAAKLNAMGYSY